MYIVLVPANWTGQGEVNLLILTLEKKIEKGGIKRVGKKFIILSNFNTEFIKLYELRTNYPSYRAAFRNHLEFLDNFSFFLLSKKFYFNGNSAKIGEILNSF